MHRFHHRLRVIKRISIFLSCLILAFLTFYVIQKKENILIGLAHIITSPAILITDFILVGGIGAAFMNALLIFIFNFVLIRILKIKITGIVVACLLTVFGFSFFGKNILNILPFYIGGIFYCIYVQEELADNFVPIAFSSALAPFVSEIAFQVGSSESSYVGAIILGIAIGFVICPLAKKMYHFHEGFNLYNLGFTGGILGACIASVLKLYDVPIKPQYLVSTEHHFFLTLLCSILFASLIVIGLLIKDAHIKQYGKLVRDSGFHTDFMKKYGYGLSFINMGVMGFFCMGFLFLEGQSLNGPILAGIFTVVGFAAYGKTPLNTFPILLGVHLASYGSNTPIFGVCLSGLFGTALAPIAGVYGILWGIVAGWLHLSVVQSIGIIHGGLNLYNNGFSCGIVASVLLPIMNMLSEQKAKSKLNLLKRHKVYIQTINRHFEEKIKEGEVHEKNHKN